LEKVHEIQYRIGVISDVHANVKALEAVLRDGNKKGIDEWVCTGDLVNYGPRPSEVIEVVRCLGFTCVMGNRDWEAVSPAGEAGVVIPEGRNPDVEKAAFRWTRERLTEADRRYLEALPATVVKPVCSRRVAFFHGAPWSMYYYMSTVSIRECIPRLTEQMQASAYCFGHTHIPFVLRGSGRLFVNAGSSGKPKDGDPRACYAMLSFADTHGRGTGPESAEGIDAEIVRVEYDVDSVAGDMIARGLPEELARALVTGRSVD